MADSTGPILVTGLITVANGVILNSQPFDVRIIVGTGAAAGILALVEHAGGAGHDLAVGVAWIGLVTLLLTRVNGKPSPTENLLKYLGY